ncbi:small ribosomal subunit biogenesis GTPase RsgA 1, mitochondrial-like, partial [Chenopodium quinoa]|uniref:small ribosomal subunit biogenesis GTPase RsgA 1, mitochondrial-like n=1 Tax=Chenopodium quinoa TaxID=63459 RepID=UPI000B76C759
PPHLTASTTAVLFLRLRFSLIATTIVCKNTHDKSKQAQSNALKAARETTRINHIQSSPLSSLLNSHILSPNQAIGLVASAQANFMRVIVQSTPPEPKKTSRTSEKKDVNVLKGSGSGAGIEFMSLATVEDEQFELLLARHFKFNYKVILVRDISDIGSVRVSDLFGSNTSGFGSGQFGCRVRIGSTPFSGRVRSFSSHRVWVRIARSSVVRAVLKKIKRRVLVGDRVLVGSIDWVNRRGMIENVFPRESEIPDPPIANADHFLVVFSLDQPKVEPYSLTRFLVETESTGFPLTLALNKCELVRDEVLIEWKTRLRQWGYAPIFCSVESKRGLDSLAFYLRDRTTVIVGPSGVGKSSLINALRSNDQSPNLIEEGSLFDPNSGSKWFEEQRVREVSARSGRGKHTTRNVSLLPLAGGGYLADTPGFSQPSLIKVTKHTLSQALPSVSLIYLATINSFCLRTHLGQLYNRNKVGDMGVTLAEPRLEPKKHRRQSRKKTNQSLLDELDELDDDDDVYLEDNPIIRAMEQENQ